MTLIKTWPHAHAFALSKGKLKAENSDFKVRERLPEEPTGEGEHLWLKVEKDGQNTAWIARQLSKWAGVNVRDVSYAGLKDRHAVTEQTFSIHLPGKAEPPIGLIHIDGVRVVSHQRSIKKLKTGQLVGNYFDIRIRDSELPNEQLEQHWSSICALGVPNYFGQQRFGHGYQNVEKGIAWLLGQEKAPRQHQSIYLSAVRSYLFNQLLADRVQQGNWASLIDGDFVQFTEGKAGFYCEQVAQVDQQRCAGGSVSPCGSLPGDARDEFESLDQREATVLLDYANVIEALRNRRVARHFRKFRVFPEQPTFQVVDGDPVFSFFLPAGSYATAVLTEIIDWQDSGDESVQLNE